MTTETAGSSTRRIGADAVVALVLAAVFAVAFYLALGWQREAAVFPLAASGLGVLLATGYLVQSLVRGSAPTHAAGSEAADEDTVSDPLDYVFATASRREWLVTVGFFAGFFAMLWVAGLYLTAPVFTVLYLRSEGRRSWRFALTYAAILTATLYVIFAVALRQPVPVGLLGVG